MDTKLEMMDDYSSQSLEGDMSIPAGTSRTKATIGSPDFNTLDEPIKETILRDIRAVGIKFSHVLYPKEKSTLLKDWDLWGPLVLCTLMATMLQGSSDREYDGGPEFAQVFVIVWIGAAVVTLNSKLLGGKMLLSDAGSFSFDYMSPFTLITANKPFIRFAFNNNNNRFFLGHLRLLHILRGKSTTQS
ncbi:protein YIPF6 isoform 2-T2 [Glossina fuscipes fuscipes]